MPLLCISQGFWRGKHSLVCCSAGHTPNITYASELCSGTKELQQASVLLQRLSLAQQRREVATAANGTDAAVWGQLTRTVGLHTDTCFQVSSALIVLQLTTSICLPRLPPDSWRQRVQLQDSASNQRQHLQTVPRRHLETSQAPVITARMIEPHSYTTAEICKPQHPPCNILACCCAISAVKIREGRWKQNWGRD